MLSVAIKELQEQGVQKYILEVITDNQPALSVYQKAGFQIVRNYQCFQGEIPILQQQTVEIKEVP
jgi:RimJ/RimL family protein N-acetyltransferase